MGNGLILTLVFLPSSQLLLHAIQNVNLFSSVQWHFIFSTPFSTLNTIIKLNKPSRALYFLRISKNTVTYYINVTWCSQISLLFYFYTLTLYKDDMYGIAAHLQLMRNYIYLRNKRCMALPFITEDCSS